MSGDNAKGTGTQAWVVLGLLMCFYQLSFLDKQMYSLLINPLGEGLNLSDLELGMVQGIGFSGFYTLGMIFTGWAADVYSRRTVLFWGVLFWSICATFSGLVINLETLFMARAGVGLGEAVLIPTAFALLAAYFPRDRLSMATGIFMAGANIGGILAMLVGGQLIAALSKQGAAIWPVFGLLEPWQAAFVVTGIPGLFIAFLAFGIPADRNREAVSSEVSPASRTSDEGLFAFCRSRSPFLASVMLVGGLLSLLAYAVIIWSPAYFERAFGWDYGRIGIVIATGMAFGGLGNILWGWVADRMRRAGRRDALYILYAGLTSIGLPIAALTFLTRNETIATVGYAAVWLVLTSFGPMLSAIQFGIPDRFRGRLIGIKSIIAGVFGLSGGPIIVSLFTDKVFADKSMLGHSIVATLGIAGIAAVLLMLTTRRIYVDAVIAQEEADARGSQDQNRTSAAVM